MDRPTIAPRVWQPSRPAKPAIEVRPINKLTLLPVAGHGPEDVLVGSDGRIFTGLDDGRIIALTPDGRQIDVVGDTGGRPLGLEWHPEGWIVVCDAQRGLLRLDVHDGRVDEFVTEFDGMPIRFCNNAAVADNVSMGSDGLIWVALASMRNALLDRMLPLPGILRKAAWRLPEAVQPKEAREFEVHAYDDTGRLTYAFRGTHPDFHFATGVREHKGTVWLGSLEDASVAAFVP
ncbi:MAG TPA: hypothetical protein VEX15_16210 [Nocardioidaceae bacterium]|nr:hypothetical protein [Nocardioidaceae bacterium]